MDHAARLNSPILLLRIAMSTRDVDAGLLHAALHGVGKALKDMCKHVRLHRGELGPDRLRGVVHQCATSLKRIDGIIQNFSGRHIGIFYEAYLDELRFILFCVIQELKRSTEPSTSMN